MRDLFEVTSNVARSTRNIRLNSFTGSSSSLRKACRWSRERALPVSLLRHSSFRALRVATMTTMVSRGARSAASPIVEHCAFSRERNNITKGRLYFCLLRMELFDLPNVRQTFAGLSTKKLRWDSVSARQSSCGKLALLSKCRAGSRVPARSQSVGSHNYPAFDSKMPRACSLIMIGSTISSPPAKDALDDALLVAASRVVNAAPCARLAFACCACCQKRLA